jgi:hypothetical protein
MYCWVLMGREAVDVKPLGKGVNVWSIKFAISGEIFGI